MSIENDWQKKCFCKDRIKFQRKMIDKDLWQCCLNCEHFNRNEMICKKFKATPPIETLLVGCEEWIYDIPF